MEVQSSGGGHYQGNRQPISKYSMAGREKVVHVPALYLVILNIIIMMILPVQTTVWKHIHITVGAASDKVSFEKEKVEMII